MKRTTIYSVEIRPEGYQRGARDLYLQFSGNFISKEFLRAAIEGHAHVEALDIESEIESATRMENDKMAREGRENLKTSRETHDLALKLCNLMEDDKHFGDKADKRQERRGYTRWTFSLYSFSVKVAQVYVSEHKNVIDTYDKSRLPE